MTEAELPDVKSSRFKATDMALIAMMIVPLIVCILLKAFILPGRWSIWKSRRRYSRW